MSQGGGQSQNDASSERKYTSEDLKTMQAWDLNRKIQVSQTRLIEWYMKWNGKCYVSFSGGKDSTVGCHLDKEPNRFQRLKQTHPGLWEYCMKPYDDGGLGMKEVLEYIGVKTGAEDEE